MTGTNDDNIIHGDSGDDRIVGGGSNDTLDGGSGSDTVVYSGNRSDYTITASSDPDHDFMIVDNRAGSPDGTDLVDSMSYLEFADITIRDEHALSTAPTANADDVETWSDRPAVFDVLANDTDPEGDALSIAEITSLPAKGSAYVVDNQLVFDPGDAFDDLAPDERTTVEITCQATDGNGWFSEATATIEVVAPPQPEPAVIIAGSASEDQTLSAEATNLGDPGSIGPVSYLWLRDGVAIAGAAGAAYILTQDDVGAEITVEASWTDSEGTAQSLTSGATSPVANVNDLPVGTVTISGAVEEDQTLTADTSTLGDADGLGTVGLQWLRDGAPIAGETGESYVLTQDEVGAEISAQASWTDDQGTAESVTRDVTVPVANVNDLPTGGITITGDAVTGSSLTVDTSALADEDGLGALTVEWLRDGTTIAGAAGAAYELTPDDHGAVISAQVSYTDGGGTFEEVTSLSTASVRDPNQAPTGEITIGGFVEIGETLAANTDTLADGNGLGSFACQWFADGTAVAGATAADFEIGAAQAGQALAVSVSWIDGEGCAETVMSAATRAVQVPVVNGDNDENTLEGDDHADLIKGRGGDDELYGSGGDDELGGGSGNDRVLGGAGDDLLFGGTGNDKLYGQSGDDKIKGGHGNDLVSGGVGNDLLYGHAGNDTVRGGSGEDRVSGGTGDDVLTGGRQADLFLFKTGWGIDTITDFDAKGGIHDTLNLRGLETVRNWNDLVKHHLEVDGDDVIIDGRNGDVIVLQNVDLADLDKGDFIF